MTPDKQPDRPDQIAGKLTLALTIITSLILVFFFVTGYETLPELLKAQITDFRAARTPEPASHGRSAFS